MSEVVHSKENTHRCNNAVPLAPDSDKVGESEPSLADEVDNYVDDLVGDEESDDEEEDDPEDYPCENCHAATHDRPHL
jgi:hypothetical protein